MARLRAVSFFVFIAAALSCGGPQPTVSDSAPKPHLDSSEAAIAVLRKSLENMGGLERIRLYGGRAVISATADAGGEKHKIEMRLGGPGAFRLDYVDEGISFVHGKETCRKEIDGVSVPCSEDEARWSLPLRIAMALAYPASDAAQLGAELRLLEDGTIDGEPCSVVEIRPDGPRLKMRASYPKSSGLLTALSFELGAPEQKRRWSLRFADYSAPHGGALSRGDDDAATGLQLPHSRSVSLDGVEIWREVASAIDFGAVDARAFDPPTPPTMELPHRVSVPSRLVVETTVHGVAVALPAPPPVLGGAWPTSGAPSRAEGGEALRIVHRGRLSDVPGLISRLQEATKSEGTRPLGDPRVLLLEEAKSADEPVLMIVYIPVAAEGPEGTAAPAR